MKRAARLLRALILSGLASLLVHTHAFVAFQPVRVKVVEASVAAAQGEVRVSGAGFPALHDLRPPFALIARIKAASPGSSVYSFTVDGVKVCERSVAGGAPQRVDCAVAAGWDPAAAHEVTIEGPQAAWTLEYLELATHHGHTSGAHTLVVLPRDSTACVRPAAVWALGIWIAVAGLLLLPASHPSARSLRWTGRVVSGALVGVLALIQVSERVSDYKVVLAAGTLAAWLAILLVPWLWTAGRRLSEWTERAGWRPLPAVRARGTALLAAHPAWDPTGARAGKAWRFAAPAAVMAVFCAPLFFNLGEPEARSDEPIYSYAVERILDTGDWLTPRLIPDDRAMLEKPPLKFWLVASGIRAGLLSRDDAGMRWFDALFGSIGFVYVFLLGRRLAGTICGLTAVLVLFTLEPLLFEHGLRSNNMESPLFLACCGGIFHFAAWVEPRSGRARGHAFAAAGWFLLGFMTKFVAVLFLPVVCAVALAWRPGGCARARSDWRDWIVPGLLAVGLAAPWFVYQTAREGAAFWQIIVGTHVYQRFASTLDPGHLQPWHYYFVRTWDELRAAGTHWLALAGLTRLAVAAARGESWIARLVLVWGMLPTAAISFGTSKLVHYLYPFWPALGLAAGLVAADLLRRVEGPWGRDLSVRLRQLAPHRWVAWRDENRWHRTVLLGTAAAAGAVALWTALTGRFEWTWGGATFSVRSVAPPLALAAAALFAGGEARALVRTVAVVGLLATASVPAYGDRLAKAARPDHPIRALRDCMVVVQRAGEKTGDGVLSVERDLGYYAYYYYLSPLGRWDMRQSFSVDEAVRRLTVTGGQTPVIVSHADYDTLVRYLGLWETIYPAASRPEAVRPDPMADAARHVLRSGARFNEKLAVLLPGPFRSCLPSVLASAGQPLWTTPADSRKPGTH